MEEYRLEAQLLHLPRAATADDAATLVLDDLAEGYDPITIPSAEFSGPSHPFVRVRRSLGHAGLEATILHEAAHWRLGHVTDPDQREAVEADDRARDDRARAAYEIAADEFAMSELLADPSVVAALASQPGQIMDHLRQDCRRFGGCQ